MAGLKAPGLARKAKAGAWAAAGSGPAPDGGVRLRVTGPAKGFRRAGRAFGPAPVDITPGELTAAQRLAIEAEPALVVEWIGVERPAD